MHISNCYYFCFWKINTELILVYVNFPKAPICLIDFIGRQREVEKMKTGLGEVLNSTGCSHLNKSAYNSLYTSIIVLTVQYLVNSAYLQ